MNCLKKALPFLAMILFIATSCKKTSRSEEEASENQITNDVSKIETDWNGVGEKNNYDFSSEKKESRASDDMISTMMKKIDEKYQNYLSRLGTNINSAARLGNVVGVIKNGTTCNGYDEVEIGMDEEDDNPQTGWDATRGNYRPNWTISGNPILRFCIVPGNDFHAYVYTNSFGAKEPFRYAVLQ